MITKNLIKRLAKILVARVSNQDLYNLSDDAWNMLALWFFHESWKVELENEDPKEFAKSLNPSELSDLKARFNTDSIFDVMTLLEKFHEKRANELEKEIEKKYPKLNPYEDVYNTFVIDKFYNWSEYHTNVGREPRKKYI